jgi:hypothetical protein
VCTEWLTCSAQHHAHATKWYEAATRRVATLRQPISVSLANAAAAHLRHLPPCFFPRTSAANAASTVIDVAATFADAFAFLIRLGCLAPAAHQGWKRESDQRAACDTSLVPESKSLEALRSATAPTAASSKAIVISHVRTILAELQPTAQEGSALPAPLSGTTSDVLVDAESLGRLAGPERFWALLEIACAIVSAGNPCEALGMQVASSVRELGGIVRMSQVWGHLPCLKAEVVDHAARFLCGVRDQTAIAHPTRAEPSLSDIVDLSRQLELPLFHATLMWARWAARKRYAF